MKRHWFTFVILFGMLTVPLILAAEPFLPTNPGKFPYPASNYDEPYRPQFHYTAQGGYLNDINGVWYINGIYHVSYQAYPYSLDMGPRGWGHATSLDMLHWSQQPVMLDPEVNAPGDCWSGSAIVDTNNTSGFKTGENPPLVAIYTATSKGTCLAYSNDLGNTWVAYSGNPVLIGGSSYNPNYRDPHVFWYAPTSKWVCVFMENGYAFYTSPDLKIWTKESTFNWGWECPDMFELAVDGGATKKWVLVAGDAQYRIGTFNGKTFVADTGGPYYMVNNSGIGAGFYAAQSFFRNNFPSDRVIQMGWMSGLGSGSTSPWTHNSSFPCEVKLKTFPEGVRAARLPISEISSLYGTTQTWGNQTLKSGQNLFAGNLSKCFDVEVVFDVTGTTASTISFQFANRVATYDLKNKTLFGYTLKPINNQVKIRFLVDWGELEAFGNDGQYSYAENFKFSPANSSISMTANGNISLVSARFSTVNRTWQGTACNKYTDDADSETLYHGTWGIGKGESGYYNGTCHYSKVVNDYVQYAFNGTQIAWYGLKNNDLGMAAVYIDSVLMADDIDCYSTSRMSQLLFSKTGLSNGNHILKLVVKGTKNTASSGTSIVHDYFGFIGAPLLPTAVDDTVESTVYNGTWSTITNDTAFYSYTGHQCNSANGYIQYSFKGPQVYWYGLTNVDLGMAAVYIDGELASDTIDCYSTTRAVKLLFSKTYLSNGNHTIRVVVKGTRNAASSGTAIVHDYFDFPEVPPTIIDDASASTTYNGAWTSAGDLIYWNGTCHYSSTVNGYFQITFTGTDISWYGLKNNDLGKAAVYIDGTLAVDNIDCYSTTREVIKLFSKTGLSAGTHTIKVVVKGIKNASSSGTALVHDYFMVPYTTTIATIGNLTFGSVVKDSIASKIITIKNTGNTLLVVNNIVLPDGFSADWTNGEIAEQKEQKVNITFSPKEIKDYDGILKIKSNADSGVDSMTINGSGATIVAINVTKETDVKCYPNPVQNSLTITTEGLSSLEISDITGKILIKKKMANTMETIDMSDYSSGIFILKVTTAKGGFLVQKIIKN